jgi:hypothetical protein
MISSITPLTRQMPEVVKQVTEKADIPADVKAQVEAFNKDVTALAARLVPPQGGRGGGGGGRGGGAEQGPVARAAQAKNGMMGGMWPTQATMTAYNDAKIGVPALLTEAAALITKAQTLSSALAKHGVTLTVPAPVKTTDALR